MASRTIAVGRAADPLSGRVDLVLLPGETPPELRPGLTVYSPPDLRAALHLLRAAFAEHSEITTLADADVIGETDPVWTAAIESRLAEFIEDLGNCTLDCWEGALHAIRNADRIAAGPTSDQLRDLLDGHPAICIAAGPSASPEALEAIRRLAPTHYIFCVEVMLGACLKAGFTPDFVTVVERPAAHLRLLAGLNTRGPTLVAPAVVHPDVADSFERVVWWRGGDRFYDTIMPGPHPEMIGRSTGVLCVSAALLAGCNPLYLVGHDLAYGAGHVSHAPAAHAEAAGSLASAEQNPPDCYGRQQLEARGWSGQAVAANGFWNLFRGDIECTLANYPGRTAISAQGGAGAAIAGVIPGTLPEPTPGAPLLSRPEFHHLPGPANAPLVPTLLADLAELKESALAVAAELEGPAPGLDTLADRLAISRNVSPRNAPLLQYVFQALNSALSLRLRARGACVQADCLRLCARTIAAMSDRMRADLTQ